MSRERNSRHSRGASSSHGYSKNHGRTQRGGRDSSSDGNPRFSEKSFSESRGDSRGGKKKSSRRDESRGKKPVFHSSYVLSRDQVIAEEAAIAGFKTNNRPVCEKCGQPITDMSTAIENKTSGKPIHFDCALKILSEQERVEEGDRITYIGQGRFGIVNFPNIHDMKHFSIKKIIEWENKENKPVWRNEMAELYSQVK